MCSFIFVDPAGLEPVITVRQPRIGRAYRAHQCVDDLALDPVGEMPRIRNVREAAPTVGDLLVLGERVGDQREGSLIGLERFSQRLRRRLALFAGAILQQVQRWFDRQLPGADLEAQARDGLIEQPVPGAVTALGFFMEQLLDTILELIRLVLAETPPPAETMGRRPRWGGP